MADEFSLIDWYKNEQSDSFLPAKNARARSDEARKIQKKNAMMAEWLDIKTAINKAIDEGRISVLIPNTAPISIEIVELLTRLGYSVSTPTRFGPQSIHW